MSSGCRKERAALKGVYPNRRWYLKIGKLTDEEVVAMCDLLKQQNKL